MTIPHVTIVHSALPPYRQAFLKELLRLLGDRLLVVSGDSQFQADVREGIDLPDLHMRKVRNNYLLGRRFLWQSGSLQYARDPGVVVLELNPRILSTWTCLFIRRALRRPTILWGHAWPRGGQHAWTDRVRHIQRQLAHCLLVYTPLDRDALQRKMPRHKVVVAPNAVYSRNAMGSDKSRTPSDIIYSGRLVPQKKPQLLLEAFIAARRVGPESFQLNASLTFVGTGSLEEPLRRRAAEADVLDHVNFLGEVWDTELLRHYYDRAFVAISSGYAGLNVVQASSFGTRIAVADTEPHAPEISFAVRGFNGLEFASESVFGLAMTLITEWEDRGLAQGRARAIVDWAMRECSVEAMARGFLEAAKYSVEGLGQ